MIAVIADDFTGAAEIAGLGLRYGLKVEIESHLFTESNADLLIIATDTRSKEAAAAYEEVFLITQKLKNIGCDWIYKKTDSVFRGHIYTELRAMLDANGIKKALLVPANPEIGRKIKDGIYFVDNKFIHETNFAEDPEYPVTTSDVMTLMRTNEQNNVYLLRANSEIYGLGISIGEAVSEKDLDDWAMKINSTIIPAGGAGFFKALLEAKGYKRRISIGGENKHFGEKFLFVCGSAFSKGKVAFKNQPNCQRKTFPMPDAVFNNTKQASKFYKTWEESVINAFDHENFVILEIDQPVIREKKFAKRLREEMARLVEHILDKVEINELLIDGGATVYSIAERVGLTKFFPVQEIAPGVIRMKVQNKENLHITIKPGSYPWPESLLKVPCIEK